MIRKVIVAASVGLLLTGQVAMAAGGASLGGVQGSVLVNQNGRYVPVTSSTVLKAGDRVMAMDGSATVNYGGCSVNVAARSLAVVGDAATCAKGSSNIVRSAYFEETDGYGGPTNPPGQGWDFWLWATYGVITIGVTAVVINDSDSPSSP